MKEELQSVSVREKEITYCLLDAIQCLVYFGEIRKEKITKENKRKSKHTETLLKSGPRLFAFLGLFNTALPLAAAVYAPAANRKGERSLDVGLFTVTLFRWFLVLLFLVL